MSKSILPRFVDVISLTALPPLFFLFLFLQRNLTSSAACRGPATGISLSTSARARAHHKSSPASSPPLDSSRYPEGVQRPLRRVVTPDKNLSPLSNPLKCHSRQIFHVIQCCTTHGITVSSSPRQFHVIFVYVKRSDWPLVCNGKVRQSVMDHHHKD